MEFLAVFAVPFLLALLLTPTARKLSRKWGILSVPGGRRRHKLPIPLLGGIALAAAYFAGIVVIYLVIPPSGDDARRLSGVIIGSLVLFAGGLIDDFRELSPVWQFLIQFVGVAIAVVNIVFIEVFTNPINGQLVWIDWRPLAIIITLVWIVGIINTVNWLDGLDGLAVGVGTIAALLFAWHGYRLGQDAVAAVPLALAGALLGFLPYNFAPASIFLGTAGAYLLGYNLSTLSILSPAKIATALLVLAVPILDGVWRVIDRIVQRRSPFYGDRGHLHYRLADMGVPTRVIVLGYYGLTLAFGLVAIFATGLMKLVLLVILGIVVLAILVGLSYRSLETKKHSG